MHTPGSAKRLNRRQLGAAGAGLGAILATGIAPATIRAQDKTEIRMASYTISEAWDGTVQKMVDAFNAQSTDVTVKMEFRPGDQYWDKIQTEYAGGQSPDITLNQMDWLVPGASRGMFVDLNPYYERDKIDLSDLWYDTKLEWSYEGGMYGALLYAGGQALYYNKDIFKAAGATAPAADWTWDDLLALAQTCTDEANGQYGVLLSLPSPPYWSCAFIQEAGGSVLNDARDECLLNSPECREALQWLVDLTTVHKVMPVPATEDGAENPFLSGKVAMYFGGTWDEAATRTAGFDWDFLHMPVHPTTGTRSVQMGSNAWSIISTTEHADQAWEVIKYIGGPQGASGLISLGIPGYTSVIESPDFKTMHEPQDITIPVADFTESGHNYYPTPDASEWWAAVTQELAPMWTGEDNVENSTQRATDAVNDIFSRRGSL